MQNLDIGTPVRETSEVEDFLDRLARALTGGDTKTVAQLWDVPALVISDDMVKPVASSSRPKA